MHQAALLLLLLLAAPARAENPFGLRVTTDSAEYCAELAERVAALPHSAAEPARSLAEEGRRLCAGGQLRGGIARLRRALRAARSPAS